MVLGVCFYVFILHNRVRSLGSGRYQLERSHCVRSHIRRLWLWMDVSMDWPHEGHSEYVFGSPYSPFEPFFANLGLQRMTIFSRRPYLDISVSVEG